MALADVNGMMATRNKTQQYSSSSFFSEYLFYVYKQVRIIQARIYWLQQKDENRKKEFSDLCHN